MRIDLPTLAVSKSAHAFQQNRGLTSRVVKVLRRDRCVYLKMESELPLGSYKIRGVTNALESYRQLHGRFPSKLLTISAGNMAQAVASEAKRLGLEATAIVPETAPSIKTDAISSMGAQVIHLPMRDVWDLIENPPIHRDILLIHPLVTPGILAGYAIIGLEILAQVTRPDAIFIPFGVGGLTLGIATAIRQSSPDTKIICVETDAAQTLRSALHAGMPMLVEKGKTCADAIGTPRVVKEVFYLLKDRALIDDVRVVSEPEIERAMRSLYKNEGIITEGAAAACYAAASSSEFTRPVCVLTGQNINGDLFKNILSRRSAAHEQS